MAFHEQDPLELEGADGRRRWLAEAETHDGFVEDEEHIGGHSDFGVHIVYEDLYNTIIFLTCIYLSGQLASRLLKMPSLVGEIVCGIVMGPPLLDFVPFPEAFVLLGELGLILLVIEAGIDIDMSTLKVIGARGFVIAMLGSIFPIGIGIIVAYVLNVADIKGVIAAGAVFGPTSLGIALNILRSGGILNTPVGQLIISAAVIDDMIALVVLSQLEALTGDVSIVGIIVPVISALAFLIIGGFVAIFILPDLIQKYILTRFAEEHHDKIEMTIMFALVIVMMPATYYGEASYLMGAFVSGLTFASSHGVHALFVRQFKRILQWLMRIFFSASIGFQVPITDFANFKIIWNGLVFALALLGKVGVGFLVPNFTQSRKFTKFHLRDCLITGFSMAAEGEFAFVIAVFAVDGGLISKDLYASVVLAVLISTILPPFLLRFTISYYNKVAENLVQTVAETEQMRKHDLEEITLPTSHEAELVSGIRNQSSVFLCIQTQSESKWGLLHRLMQCMASFGLDIIDHRAWQPRGVRTTLVNEVYVKSQLELDKTETKQEALELHMKELTEALETVIGGGDTCKVKVQRWYPGVVEEIVEELNEKTHKNYNVSKRLLNEATTALERKQMITTQATTSKTVDDIMGETQDTPANVDVGDSEAQETAKPLSQLPEEMALPSKFEAPKPRRRVRQKMRSTPVVGGGLFGETIEAKSGREDARDSHRASQPVNMDDLLSKWSNSGNGVPAEIIIKGESYSISVPRSTWRDLRKGHSGQMVDSRGIEISGVHIKAANNTPVVQRLQGYVRNMPIHKINEESVDGESELSSSIHGVEDIH